MIKAFIPVAESITTLLNDWEQILLKLDENVISGPRNSQNRNVRQIVGHMVDSASNNLHRLVHLQNQDEPLEFPNYAINGNNDRWIAIQNYEEENWHDLVMLWKYANLHLVHVIKQVDPAKLDNSWYADKDTLVSLKEMIIDFLRHFKLHIDEITELKVLEG